MAPSRSPVKAEKGEASPRKGRRKAPDLVIIPDLRGVGRCRGEEKCRDEVAALLDGRARALPGVNAALEAKATKRASVEEMCHFCTPDGFRVHLPDEFAPHRTPGVAYTERAMEGKACRTAYENNGAVGLSRPYYADRLADAAERQAAQRRKVAAEEAAKADALLGEQRGALNDDDAAAAAKAAKGGGKGGRGGRSARKTPGKDKSPPPKAKRPASSRGVRKRLWAVPQADGLTEHIGATTTVDRKGVERCWLLVRAHFEPAHLGALKPRDSAFFLKPATVALVRLYEWLESDQGERFEGGFPYDTAKWAPLDKLLTTFFGGQSGDAEIQVRPTCVAAAKFVGVERVTRNIKSFDEDRVRMTLSTEERGLTPRTAHACAHDLAAGRPCPETKIARLDAHACNSPDAFGERPLIAAVRATNRHEAVVDLLDRGAWPSVPSLLPGARGATALHYAAQQADPRVMKPLLEAGADPNARTSAGDVPLAFLARVSASPESETQVRECARMLLAAGAHAEGFLDDCPPHADDTTSHHHHHKAAGGGSSSAAAVAPSPFLGDDKRGAANKGGRRKKAGKNDAPAPKKAEPPKPVPETIVPFDGAPVGDSAGASRFTPLHAAAAMGNMALVGELVLRGGAKPERPTRQPPESDASVTTALVLAARTAEAAAGDPHHPAHALVAALRNHLAPLPAAGTKRGGGRGSKRGGGR